jgi:signal transduction histidine kinase
MASYAAARQGWIGHFSAGREVFGGEVEVLARHLSRFEDLERRLAESEEHNRQMAVLLADVAHDLRSPLQAVVGFTELVIRREGARLDETSRSFLTHVLSAADAMRELVETVLEHRRSSSATLELTGFDSNDVVQAIILRLGQRLDDAGARIVIDELPPVRADRVQFGRIIQNLVDNALLATRPGERPLITIAARRRRGAWEFSVTDNGIGVPAADRQRIFELFERGAGTGNESTGKGMGLAICRAIVERHGGRIGVEKAPEGGSRFSFTLPDELPAGAVGAGDPRPVPADRARA